MKKVLITGANSYIGTSFEKYINENYPNDYQIDTLDLKNSSWKNHDFRNYDAVFHVAGIAHKKETKENSYLYYEVNRDLAIEVAKKAKLMGGKHFIFMSSMSVYGLDYSEKLINKSTLTNPKTNYGKSKLQAEHIINSMKDDNFKVAVLRPPMVYGINSPGNLTKLFNMVRKIHLFPTIKNKRSFISVEYLSKFIKTVIDNNQCGILLPQNPTYACTYEMVKEQMDKENIKVIYLSVFNPIIRFMIGKVGLISKIFGDLKYEK